MVFQFNPAPLHREVPGAVAESVELPFVRLRPMTDDDDELLGEIEACLAEDEWDGYDDAPEDALSAKAYGGGSAVVEREDGVGVGSVSWIQVPHGPNRQSLAWCIGITVLPIYRGRHLGTAAQKLLAETLLATTPANRVEAETDVDNIAERRSLERAGFVFEGIARQANWRRGAWHDMAIYSTLRPEALAR